MPLQKSHPPSLPQSIAARRLNNAGVDPPLLSAASCDTNISDYIGSGTSSGGGQSPRPYLRSRTPDLDSDSPGDSDRDPEPDPQYRPADAMDDPDPRRPALFRPTDGRSGTPLLHKADERRGRTGYDGKPPSRTGTGSGSSSRATSPFLSHTPSRPTFSRRSTMRSVSPSEFKRDSARQKYTYAAFFLFLSLVSFTIQTELSAYIQHTLHWDKAYCMLFFTHGSWVILWPLQLLTLRLQKRNIPWAVFWRRHTQLVRTTAIMVQTQDMDVAKASVQHKPQPLRYMIRTTAFVTSALTVAGLSWYVAVNMTSPSDLTAIYNCSAFFAYVFSVPLLKEPLRRDKSVAVAVAIAGVLVVAYGDSKPQSKDGTADPDAGNRFLGNIIIGVGSVLYGLYEVLYKRYACPPEGVSPGRGVIFAMTFGSCIGAFTLLVLWIPLPLLHITGLEPFVFPTGRTGWLVLLSVLSNATFSGSFLVLISLTSPVLSSVAALLTIFIVALVDWWLTGEPLSFAAVLGGLMIIFAFLMLSWSTWREMQEQAAENEVVLTDSAEESDAESELGDRVLR